MVCRSLVKDLEHHGLEDEVDLVGEPLLVVLARLRVGVGPLHLFPITKLSNLCT